MVATINQTSTLLNEFDYITSVDTDIAILQTTICIISLPISFFLIYGIVLYEHEGVDSQKGSIFNQLISAAFITLGSNGLIVTVSISIRCWTGPLGHLIGLTVSIIRRFLLSFFSMLILDILIYKNLCILQPNWILKLADDFWVTFVLFWNCIFAGVSTNADWYASLAQPAIYLFISGNGDLNTATEMWKLYSVMWAIILSLAIFYIIIRSIKNLYYREPQQQLPEGRMLNNMAHNPALINSLQILFVIFIFVLVAYCSGKLVTQNGPNGFILGSLPGVLAVFPIVPILFYAFNQNLRKFVAREVLGITFNDFYDCVC